jgi:FkbM family methyltransferase
MHPIAFARRKIEGARFRAYDSLRVRRDCVIGGETLRVEADNPGELYRIRRYMTHEPDTIQWLSEYVKPGQVFYDIGANIGVYSLFVAKRLHGQARVFAFEPESQNYASLNRNVHINGLSESVSTLCMAVSSSYSVDSFYVRGHLRAGEAIHQFGRRVDHLGNPFNPVHQQGMIGVSMDSLCGELGMPVPNHVKIDVDGHELSVIRGAARVLRDPALQSVQIEITELDGNEAEVEEIYRAFEQSGFDSMHRQAVTPGVARSNSYNTLFVRRGAALR